MQYLNYSCDVCGEMKKISNVAMRDRIGLPSICPDCGKKKKVKKKVKNKALEFGVEPGIAEKLNAE